jgi:hypothetical protein
MWSKYGKLITQLVGALVLAVAFVVQEATSDGSVIDASEWVLVAIAAVGAVDVWGTANITGFEKGKTLISALMAALGLLVSLITDGIQGQEWLGLIILFVTTLGVSVSPAEKHRVIDGGFTTGTSRGERLTGF